MKRAFLSLLLCSSVGCGSIASIYDRGFTEPLGGWARNVRRIEAATHDDPKAIYASYGYGAPWTKTGVVISVIDYPFSLVADVAMLPITIPAHYIDKNTRKTDSTEIAGLINK